MGAAAGLGHAKPILASLSLQGRAFYAKSWLCAVEAAPGARLTETMCSFGSARGVLGGFYEGHGLKQKPEMPPKPFILGIYG